MSPVADPIEALPMQVSLWLEDQFGAGLAYNHPSALRFTGVRPPVGVIHRAALALVGGQPAFRVGFVADGGRIVQREHVAVACDVVEVAAGQPVDTAIRAQLGELVGVPFALDRGPLVRLRVLSRVGHALALVAGAHHIVFDGTSQMLLLDLIAAAASGHAAAPVTTARYAAAVRAAADRAQQALSAGRAYWPGTLDAAHHDGIWPADRPAEQAGGSGGYRAATAVLAPDDARRCRDTAVHLGVSPFRLLLTVLHGWLAACRPDLGGGSLLAVSVRDATAKGMMGCFVNSVPLLFRPATSDPVAAAVETCARAIDEALRLRHYPYRDLVATARSGGGPVPSPAVMVTSRRIPDRRTLHNGTVVVPDFLLTPPAVKLPLFVRFAELDGSFAIQLECSAADGSASALADRLAAALSVAGHRPDMRVAELFAS